MIDTKITQDTRLKDFCDDLFSTAFVTCIEQGASAQTAFDRGYTTLAYHSVMQIGSEGTAAALDNMAASIRRGIFHPLTGEGKIKN